jgi:acetyl-CoA acetyltransferase
MRAKVAVVGAAESDRIGVVPDESALQLACGAGLSALSDAGISRSEVDGLAAIGQPPITVAHALGITPRWVDGTMVGGCSPLMHVRHAAGAIAAGLCDVVLITHGQSGRSSVGAEGYAHSASSPESQFELPYGAVNPATTLPLGVVRFLHETGTTREQLAMVAVQQRVWASRNPRALVRDLITIEDVFASPVVSWPLHRLECCLITDGGGALVLVGAERARAMDLAKAPVYLLGAGESFEGPMISGMEDVTSSKAFRASGRQAFSEAQVAPSEVDHLMIYDAFAHLPLFGLEDLGFVGRGEAGAFIADGNTLPGGPLPLNTNGGGLSYTHTGMYGMFAIQESIRQLRSEAPAQVEGVELAVCHGIGMMFSAAATLILGTAATV